MWSHPALHVHLGKSKMPYPPKPLNGSCWNLALIPSRQGSSFLLSFNLVHCLATPNVKNVKSFPSLKAHRAALISCFLSPQPDTSFHTARPRIRGQWIVRCACLCSSFRWYSFNRSQRDGRLSWPCWLTDSGRFTHKVVKQPSISLAQDRESSPARTDVLTTMLCHQLKKWLHQKSG